MKNSVVTKTYRKNQNVDSIKNKCVHINLYNGVKIG